MFIITKVNTTRKLFTTFVHEIVNLRMLLLYFKRITRQNIFFTIISINRSDKTIFIVTFVNTFPIF